MSDIQAPLPQTPMVRQYARIKAQHQDAILFYRLGDFYEMFFEDARVASRILNIALTTRDKEKPDAIPLCGVPFHSAESYIARLVREGYKVAICEQVGDVPARGAKLVRREVVRVVTPGTILSEGFLADKRNNFLAAVNPGSRATGLAFLDITTGDFLAATVPAGLPEETASRLADFEPAEVLVPEGAAVPPALAERGSGRPSLLERDPSHFEPESAARALREQFGTITLEPFGLGPEDEEATGAAGAVLQYALETQKQPLTHIRRLSVISPAGHLLMDAATQRNLELVRSAVHGGREGTLLEIMDETLTPMGGRLLRQWIQRPLADIQAIGARLEAVAELVEASGPPVEIRGGLKRVLDIERLVGRLTLRQGGPRDLLALRDSLAPLPALGSSLGRLASPLLRSLAGRLDTLEDLHHLLSAAVRDDSPVAARDGGFVKPGFDAALDGWLRARTEGHRWIADLEAAERARTGIASLKIRYNKVFGYYLEVTKSNLKDVPPDYIRRQTLVGAERFTTPALSEYETTILEADERSLGRELELFGELREAVQARGERLRSTCLALAELDVLQGLAAAAVRRAWSRPEVDESDLLDVRDGRHPVVEALNPDEPFIPNDCLMDSGERRMLVITGPNMAGKSTYLRQTALIVLMAQAGSFVPAREARIGLVDRIFTRVGATDYLVRGQSTFMVEMTETAQILNGATPRSLVILDEIGRGTSTFDGLAIAWAVAEYLHDAPDARARTLFATHYHQLTELALTMPGVKNLHTAVKEYGDRIVFLRRIVEGGTDKSYGIHVARLAGLPAPVIARAREIMANLEAGELDTAGLPRLAGHQGGAPPSQLYLFGSPEAEALESLRAADPEGLTPLEALNLLAGLVSRLRSGR